MNYNNVDELKFNSQSLYYLTLIHYLLRESLLINAILFDSVFSRFNIKSTEKFYLGIQSTLSFGV